MLLLMCYRNIRYDLSISFCVAYVRAMNCFASFPVHIFFRFFFYRLPHHSLFAARRIMHTFAALFIAQSIEWGGERSFDGRTMLSLSKIQAMNRKVHFPIGLRPTRLTN